MSAAVSPRRRARTLGGALLPFAGLLALCWAGGWAWLRWQRIGEEAALRRRLRATHPREDLDEASDLERLVQPFSDKGRAIYEAEVAALVARYRRSVAMLTAFGLLCLMILILMARAAAG